MKVFGYLWGVLRRLLFVLYLCVRGVVKVIVMLTLAVLFLFIVAFCWLITPIDYIVTGADRHPSHYINWYFDFCDGALDWNDTFVVRRFLRLQ